eukprot:1158790-Pelagomonas_calceolata.AAC.4
MILTTSCNRPGLIRGPARSACRPQPSVSAVSPARMFCPSKHASSRAVELSQQCNTSAPTAIAMKRGSLSICSAFSGYVNSNSPSTRPRSPTACVLERVLLYLPNFRPIICNNML